MTGGSGGCCVKMYSRGGPQETISFSKKGDMEVVGRVKSILSSASPPLQQVT